MCSCIFGKAGIYITFTFIANLCQQIYKFRHNASILLCRNYDPAIFSALRDEAVVAIGQGFARVSNLAGIRTLLSSFPYALAPRLVDILSHLPEALPPKEWMPLIQEVAFELLVIALLFLQALSNCNESQNCTLSSESTY